MKKYLIITFGLLLITANAYGDWSFNVFKDEYKAILDALTVTGGTDGDVLTVQADGSIAPETGGGGATDLGDLVDGEGTAGYILKDDGDGTYSFGSTLDISTLIVPNGTAAAPTTEGNTYWNSTTDIWTIGNGSSALNLGTMPGPAAGSSYTNFGAAGDDTINELFAAIDISWPSGTGAPTDVDYWVGTTDAGLSAEIVVNSAASLETAANLGAFFNEYADDADAAAVRTTLGLVIGTDVLAQQAIGISNDNLVEIDGADIADNEYARFTANGLESRTAAEVLIDARDQDADIWQCVSVSVAGMIADGTNATNPASEAINSGPNVWFSTVSDAAGTLEYSIPMPENWDGGNVYVEILAGSNEATPAGTVEFEVQAMARGNDDLINSTWLSTVNCQFASNIDTQYDMVVAESAVIACSGAGGDMLYVKLTRDNDDGTNDTSTQDVEVWGSRVYFQIDDLDERD